MAVDTHIDMCADMCANMCAAAHQLLHPLDHPFAFALIELDGATTGFLHAVDAGSEARMHTGMRVTARWRAERTGGIHDLECFEPEDGA